MRPVYCCIVLLFFILVSCDKKEQPLPEEPAPVVPATDTTLKCADLPPDPSGLGWQDSTLDPDKNINAFIRNPINPDEVIYVAEGDMYGFNKMFKMHIPTGSVKFLATLGPYLPHINAKGWIVFSNIENNIFRVKTNGDSLMQLTSQKLHFDPHWDFTGKSIFYFQKEFFQVKSKIFLATTENSALVEIPASLPYLSVFRNTNRLIYYRLSGTLLTMVVHDMVTHEESDLLTGTYNGSAPFYFGNLTTDLDDKNLFWSNNSGIFRHNLSTKKTDTLYKNCGNFKFSRPMISFKPDEITYSWHIIKPLNYYSLFHTFKAMELNLRTGENTELKLFQ
jgi:hypothetical protein